LFANTDWYLYNFRLSLACALRDQGCDVVLVAPEGAHAQRFASHGLRFVPFAFDRLSLNAVQQTSAVVRLAALYRRVRPQLVHHFTIKCAVFGSLAARFGGHPAVVNAFTGLGAVFAEKTDRFRYTRRLVVRTLRISLAGTHVIVQNPEDESLLLKAGAAVPQRTRVIRGSGVDLNRYVPHAPQPGNRLRILLASRLIRSKGIEAFEEVASRLGSLRDVEFLLAGAPDPGNPDALTDAEVEALSRRGHVRSLGHVEEMAALLSTVDLVVLPTTYGEGVPRTLVEAAAAGLPLVATDVPGCREIVRPGVNGILVPPGNIDALTSAIDSLLVDPDRRAVMGEASRHIALEFSDERVINDTLQVYAAALGLSTSAH
jgi:glycosyltransferase involved in cell wall biosynthesis